MLGGTGKEGSGLALRWANAGHHVIIGSRARERAQQTAVTINARIGADRAEASTISPRAQKGDIVVLTVPYAAQLATLGEVRLALAGKILIDVTVPLVPPQVGRVQLPDGSSAVVKAQAMLGAAVRVVSAFQNVSANCWPSLATPSTATCWCAATTAKRARKSSRWRKTRACAPSTPARSPIRWSLKR